jgi:beta-galactosidase
MKKSIYTAVFSLFCSCIFAGTAGREVINFDSGWEFSRFGTDGAQEAGYNDSKWRTLNLPHDWAIEGFVKSGSPDQDMPVLSVVKGQWKFNKGDDLKWKAPDLDDNTWQNVNLPATWEKHSNYTEDNVYGWYRREIIVPENMKGKDVMINVGMIDDADETYLNGVLIGATGSFPPNFKSEWTAIREYKAASKIIKYGQKNVIAVRVYDAYGNGGIYAMRLDHLVEGPFDRGAASGAGGGYMSGGIGWYRKNFKMDDSYKEKRVSIDFDGVYNNSDVWINGKHLGEHPYGYTGFSYNITPFLKYGGEDNLVAVRVNVKQPCSRWYTGAGIYRHVYLTAVSPLHVERQGTYVTTHDITANDAIVKLEVMVENMEPKKDTVSIETVIFDANNSVCARSISGEDIDAGGSKKITQEFIITDPVLWSPDSPVLYRAQTKILTEDRETDSYTTSFGIRYFKFTVDQGFFLNGKHLKIKGVCLHHDLGYIGTAVNRSAIERQIKILKKMGCNAIRTSHNPPAPELLELCDTMGMLVMDEAFDEWTENKVQYGYGNYFKGWSGKDLTEMLRRDRNHPSVILWSIGNEVQEQWWNDHAAASNVAKKLADICHSEDPTRPVTAACSGPDNVMKNGIADQLDITGINYNIYAYAKYKGKKVLLGSETASALSTRGEYNLVESDGEIYPEAKLNSQCSSYDVCKPDWGNTAEESLKAVNNSPWLAGEFVWTGFDYIGEPTPYDWPSCISYFGINDLCGFPKDRFYIYQSQWTDKPMVHILPHWNWPKYKGKKIPVNVYSNCDSVELFLNGRSLGEKSFKETQDLYLSWDVVYIKGSLKAIAKKDGKILCEDEVKTSEFPAKIVLNRDISSVAAGTNTLIYITASVTDLNGTIYPDADNNINFKIKGPGEIIATGNGNEINHAFFNAKDCRAFHGKCLAIIRAGNAPGTINLSASSKMLESAGIQIDVK